MPYQNNRASMGWIGFVKLGNSIIRATSCDIKTSQEITYPEVVDGRADTTIYQLGPKVTGGTVAFPLVHDTAIASQAACISETGTPDMSNSIAAQLWALAAARDATGRLTSFDTGVRYTDSLAYIYPSCMVNSLTFTIAQSDAVQVSADVWGGANNAGDRQVPSGGDPIMNQNVLAYLSGARTATWNDATIVLSGVNGNYILGQELREFTVTLNNNLERYYTLNGLLSVFDIAPKKREVSGTIKLIGHNPNLTAYAYSNDARFTSESQIGFGFKIGTSASAVPYWATGLNGIVYEIEETAISTGLFETSTKYRALGRCDQLYDATSLGTSVAPATSPQAQGYYGAQTIQPTTYYNG